MKSARHFKKEFLSDLVEETLNHFKEGARTVRAYSNENTLVITRAPEENTFWVARESEGFAKTKTSSLRDYYTEVFGIEASY